MRASILMYLMALAFPAVCFSQLRQRPTVQPTKPPVFMQYLKSFDQSGLLTRVVLKNDISILVVEEHSYPLVEALVWIQTGYRDEPANMPGVASLMAQMLTKGTSNRTEAVLGADMKAAGGELRAAAFYDHTALWAIAPSAQFQRVLEIQADALLNPAFDPQALKHQAAILQYESERAVHDPEILANNRLLTTGFAGDRLGRGPLPPGSELSSISRDKLLGFYRSACTPGRIHVVVCGDVMAADVLRTAAGIYAKAKAGAVAPGHLPNLEGRPGFRYVQVRENAKFARILFGFRSVPADSPDFPALQILRSMLSTGEGSILNRRLKNEKKLIYRLVGRQESYSDCGYMQFAMELDTKNLDRVELAFFTELAILERQPADDAELQRARAQVQREYWEQLETVSGRTDRFAQLDAMENWKGDKSFLSSIAQVKWADVVRVARKYLSLGNCALAECLPQAEQRKVTAETIRGTISDLLSAAATQELDEREKATVPALDFPAAPGAFTPSEVRRSFQLASILRGPDLFIKEEHTLPLIHLGLFFAGGKLSESDANAGITSLLLRMMLRDTKTRSASQIYRQLEVYGASLKPVVTDDSFGVFLTVASANVEPALDLLCEMIRSPKLDAEEFERQKLLQSTAFMEPSEAETVRHRLQTALFGNFPYSLPSSGTETSLASLTLDSVQSWYKDRVQDKKPIVVVIGDTQGTSLAGYFVRNFSGSRFQDIKLPEGFPKPLDKGISIDLNSDEGAFTAVLGIQAPPAGDEDSFPLMVLQSYASGQAGRLQNRILAGLESTYDVSFEYKPELRGGSLVACLTTATADADQALKLLPVEFVRLGSSTISYRDYRSAVNSAVGALLIRREDRFKQIADVVESVVAGNGISGFEDSASRLQDVKQADLQDVAERLLKVEKSVTLRIHGK